MNNRLLTTVLSVAFIATGCAGYDHAHDEYEKGHENSQASQAMHEQHSAMMSEHHEGMGNTGHTGHHGGGHHGEGHHGEGHHGMGHAESLAGRPGKAGEVDRTIKVEANDAMRFIHDPINVKTGETIKFVITNTGAIPHEFSIGTKDEHNAHGKMMMANPEMHHGPGGSAITIAPGETETLIWFFEEAWEVEAACNIPGHYQSGMHSPVSFQQP